MVLETQTRQAVVQADGSVVIPVDVLERAGIKPGDELHVWSTGQGNLSAVLLPKLTIDELFERYGDLVESGRTRGMSRRLLKLRGGSVTLSA